MNRQQYLAEREKLVNQTVNNPYIYNDAILNRTLNFVSANYSNFMPELNNDSHKTLFKEILLHQKLSWLDIQYNEIFDHINYEGLTNDLLSLLQKQPTIICTFHLGSIRLINYFLGKNAIKFSLIISETASKDFKDLYLSIYNQQKCYHEGYQFNIISAEDANSGKQMLRDLRSGRSLLLYIDGHQGVGSSNVKNDKSVKINFLAESLFVRKGVAYFSHLAKVPIVTIANYRKSIDGIYFKFFETIYPHLVTERESYINMATQHIYDNLSTLVRLYPGQWETWMYLHTMIKPEEFVNSTFLIKQVHVDATYLLNQDKFGLFVLGKDYFLLNKRTYKCFNINELVFFSLKEAVSQPIEKNNFTETVFNQLVQNGVLIEATTI